MGSGDGYTVTAPPSPQKKSKYGAGDIVVRTVVSTANFLCQTASWMGDHFVAKPSAIGQPTWPTQPPIPQGVGKRVLIHVIRYMDYGMKT